MEDRISAVQQALLLLLAATLALAWLARPHPENHRFTGALQELTSFHGRFDRGASEELLRAQAEAQGPIPLAAVQAASAGPGVPTLALSAESPALRPWTHVRLATLAEVYAFGQADSKLTIGVVDVAALGAALGWRLTRLTGQEAITLQGVELVSAEVSDEDIRLQQETAQLRLVIPAAEAEVESANKRLEQETRVYEARRKNHASWKMVLKSIEAQKLATEALEQRKHVLAEAQQSYDGRAQQAERKHAVGDPTTPSKTALARVSLLQGSTAQTFDIPVALALRQVPVTPLSDAAFEKTRGAGLWDEVKGLDAAQAITAVRGHFNWHNRRVEVGGIQLSGALALQFLPCLLPLALLLVLGRVRQVGKNYSPFSTKVPETLPRVGFRSRFFDFVVVVLLPSLVALSAGASLYLIGQLPVLPGVVAALCFFLGLSAFGKLGELQELVQSVVHSHSYPPPQRS